MPSERKGVAFDVELYLLVGALFLSIILIIGVIVTRGTFSGALEAATAWMTGVTDQITNNIIPQLGG